MQVEIRKYPALRVGTVRHLGPYIQINEAFARLGELAAPARLFERPGAQMVALFYDDPDTTPAEQLRSDAAVVVAPDVELPKGLTEQRIAAGDYASTTHVGPYEQLGDTWARFMGEWLPASGRRIGDGVSYEVYHNTPMDTPKEQLRTEIRIPLAQGVSRAAGDPAFASPAPWFEQSQQSRLARAALVARASRRAASLLEHDARTEWCRHGDGDHRGSGAEPGGDAEHRDESAYIGCRTIPSPLAPDSWPRSPVCARRSWRRRCRSALWTIPVPTMNAARPSTAVRCGAAEQMQFARRRLRRATIPA